MFGLVHDLRLALRRLRNTPGFSAVAIATIAIAIGANTAVFSFVNGLLLKPLPYPDPDRIVRLLERVPSGGLNGISTLNYLDWTKQSTVFEYIAAEVGWRPTWTGGDMPTVIRGARVSPHYFDVFGVSAALGRTFVDGEDEPGRDRVVMVSHLLWQNRFGSDPAIVGRQMRLDGEAHTIVGVLPPGAFDRAAAQIWKPLAFQPSNMSREFRWLAASARLKPGVTLEQARAGMDVVAQRLARTYPASNRGWGISVDRLADVLISPQLRTAVTVLFAATVFVLLIGCANLANLALARSLSREGDIAVSAALGASRWRLVRELIVEHVVVAMCGGVAGVAVGYAMMRWIRSLVPPEALPPAVDIRLDASVLLFTFAAAVITGVLFGVGPALQTTRVSLVNGLNENGRTTTTGRQGRRLRGGLVVAEVALAFVLLVASGLLMRSFFKLLDVDPGFDATNVLTASLPVAPSAHPDPVELNAYLASIRAAIDAVPGVHATALTSALPLEGWGYGVPYSVAERGARDEDSRRSAFFKIVSPSYFDALRIERLRGRALSDADAAGAPPVAIVNEALARREFAGEDPIGHHLLVRQIVPGKTEFGPPIAWEIVGVVAGEKVNGLGDDTSAGIYVSTRQSPTYGIHLLVRADVPPQSLERTIRSAITGIDKDQALSDVRTLEQIVNQSMQGNRVMSTLLGVFSALALLLAALGIYGVISYSANQRTHEMGIRAALGASAAEVCRLVMRGGVLLTLSGMAIGLAAMIPSTDVLSSMLYGVGTYDPLTIVVVAVVLAGVAGLASFLPARRIAGADPIEALRNE
jgi:putative ABC transport system permease protein